jgi:ABC-2 type transport system ATP-binding protein
MNPQPVLEVRSVKKWLSGRSILDDASLRWCGPGVAVVIGDNGAGKSTLLRIVCGVVTYEAGDVIVRGVSLARDRPGALRSLGYLPEASELPPHLTGSELVGLVAALKGCARPGRDLAERVGALTFLDDRVGTLSLGQRRRLCLLAALTGDPPLLVLDEPTNGLSVEGVAMLGELLRERTRRGLSCVVATHDSAFVDAVADARFELRAGKLAPS